MELTNEQTKQTGLAMIAFSEGKKVEAAYVQSPNSWHDVDYPNWHSKAAIFRPKPQPVSRPWSNPEDVPGPVCWIRRIDERNKERMIVYVDSSGVDSLGVGVSQMKCVMFGGEFLKWEYSTDRKTWKPCTVEGAQ